MKPLTKYLWAIFLCLLTGYATSLLQRESVELWYPTLYKPLYTPSGSVFSIVWLVLYVLMGISLGRIWGKGFTTSTREGWIQLALGFGWSVAFFVLHELFLGVVILLIMDFVVLDYIIATFRKDKVASLCFAPLFLWLLVCTYFNAYIYIYN